MSKRQTLGRQWGARRAALAALALLTLCAAHAVAQREAPASVSGRVTEGERGVAGVAIVVTPVEPSQRFKPLARARTDAEGRYRVTGVPPGRYVISPVAPAYVLLDANSFPPGKPLTLSAGDSVDDTDFRIVRGAVITGRVTDSDGNPVVAEPVSVTPAEVTNQQQRQSFFGLDQRDMSTDDRGVFRIYGLQPGRYRVSVGGDGRMMRAPGAKHYRRTFHPSAVEESQAKTIELTAGGEATDVDITLGPSEKTYRASGRFVMAETNQPAQVSAFGYGMLDPSGRPLGDYIGGSSNARGEFQVAGLTPGRYKVYAYLSSSESVDWYSDSASFEITDSDVSGLVVKLRRGSSVSGVVTVEGLSDRGTAARMLAGVRVYGSITGRGEQGAGPRGFIRAVTVGPDGGFLITGVRPGTLHIEVNTETKGLSLARVEVAGAEQREGINITEGAQVSGVRVVLFYGSATLRGQLNFPSGAEPPKGARMVVIVRRVGSGDSRWTRGAEADARGRFQIEGIPAGEYEVQGRAFGGGVSFMSEPQRVSVNEGGDVTISLTLAPPPGGPAPGNNQ